ncbi:MAG: ABC transporter ATP-binding protein/permease [Anaerolineae bacterium]|jgi:ATP-binding cassette subfamily B protein|nr:ABC transporter ATP-binding protein/permease [Anaerolineae bacterium]
MAFMYGLHEDKYDRQYTDWYLIRRIAAYFGKYRRELIYIMITLIGLSVFSAVQPIWFAQGIEALAPPNSGDSLGLILAALILSSFFYYGANWIRRQFTSYILGYVVAGMREDAFKAAVERDLAFYDTNKSGKIVSRITTDTQDFGEVVLIASDVLSQLISLVILLIVLLNQSVTLTIVLLLTTPLSVSAAVIFRNLARRVTRQGSRAMAEVNDQIQESVTGISVAKNFRREAMIYDEFIKVNVQSYHINMRRGFVLALIFPVLNALAGIAVAIVTYFSAQQVIVGAIQVGAWYLFVQAVDRFWFPFINLSAFWSQFQQALSSTERIFALIDAENTVKQFDSRPVNKLNGLIEFKNVTFEYLPGQPILKNFNLTIHPGESVAFVGHTGAGKSTIAKLITRFYEFQGGQILIDGEDIRSLNLQTYRAKLGIVPQQPFLFSGTILENIRYSRPDASDQEIAQIANSIGGGEWLETLPEGLYSDVGERGARLSMGQRQLVALVRVLLQKPSIFILDEATASVDPFTETQIQEALEMILAQSTSILIAHRLSTVQSADRIIVLKGGEIIEQGSHDQLMRQNGHYAELYNTYFRHQSLSYIENARQLLGAE